MPIGISFPFKETTDGGIFKATKTSEESTRTNLICLLTTKRGQRPMRNAFFSPLYDFIHEPMDDILEEQMKSALEEKIITFVPEIVVKDIFLTPIPDQNLLEVEIAYSIPSLGSVEDKVSLSISTQNQ